MSKSAKFFILWLVTICWVSFSWAQPPEETDKKDKKKPETKVRTVTIPISIFSKQELKGNQTEEYVEAGDIIVIPAGVGHKNLGDKDLGVVGAYPNGMQVDIMRGEAGERPGTDNNIAAVPFPQTDPFTGKGEGLNTIWKDL